MIQSHTLGKDAAAAYEQLRQEILSSQLASGTLLQQVELARQLGMSRTPIRHALHQLAADGLVEFLPGQVARVVAPTMRDALEMRQIRLWLEVPAFLLALRNQPTAEPLHEILDAVAALDDDPTPETCEQIVALDERFHRWILRASGNRQLEAIGSRLLDLLFRGQPFSIMQDYRSVRSNLLALREALAANDLRRMRTLMIEHMTDVSGMMVDPIGLEDVPTDKD